jgi:hypothetical protein
MRAIMAQDRNRTHFWLLIAPPELRDLDAIKDLICTFEADRHGLVVLGGVKLHAFIGHDVCLPVALRAPFDTHARKSLRS